jgi:hypothetical protein
MNPSNPQTRTSIQITAHALAKRINRRWADNDYKIVKLTGRQAAEYGEWVVIERPNAADVRGWGKHGPLHSRFCHAADLEALGREVGALAPHEVLAR